MRIKNIPIVNRKNYTFSLDQSVAEKLEIYCELYYLKNEQEVSTSQMLEAIINDTIDRDRAYKNYLKEGKKPEASE